MNFSVKVASPEQRAQALRLVFQHFSHDEREERSLHALHLIDRGELDPAGLWIAESSSGVIGAIICQMLPGAIALVWPPQTITEARSEQVEDALADHACRWLRQQGAKLAQALLDVPTAALASSLLRNGFPHVTQLEYMRHGLELPLAILTAAEQLEYESYQDADPARFGQTLLQTYEQSADFPEVSGVREIHQVIEGHRAQGLRDTAHWSLAFLCGRPIGVLIIAELSDCWDLSYVGVIPEARGRGFGRELVCKALVDARAAEIPQLTLTVDRRNDRARLLYRQLGFEVYDVREVFLASWR